jgi:hypothetical protein
MSPPDRHGFAHLRTAAAAALVAAACASAGARPAQPPPDEVVDDAPPNAAQVGMFEVSRQQFDMWVFGNTGRANAFGSASFDPRERLESTLKMKVEELTAASKLSSAQEQKLLLAGHGDIKRFLDQVEAKRKEFEAVRKDQQKFGNFYQTLQPLRNVFNGGMFAEGSIFAKSVRRTLDPEQSARFEETLRERAAYRYDAAVSLLTSKLGLALGMTTDQRKRFHQLILDETRPPKAIGTQEFNAVFYQAALVPRARFRAFLDDAQMRVLDRQFDRMSRWEMSLKASGYVPADPPANRPGASAKKE